MARLFDKVHVYAYVGDKPVVAGTFETSDGCGQFAYDPVYLTLKGAYSLDPLNLPIRPDTFRTHDDGGFFGAILDCCPQEWGQRVMNLMAQDIAERGDSSMSAAVAAEGMADPHNMMIAGSGYGSGALRFAGMPDLGAELLEPTPAELHSSSIADIRRIAEVHALAAESQPLGKEDRNYLLTGMSLGGARPKAIVTIDNELWIAKLPRARENVDIQRVEYAVNQVAALAGINVAPSRIEVVNINGVERTVFLSKRFDRTPTGVPMHYLSAATVLRAPRTPAVQPGGPVNVHEAQATY